MAVVGLVYIVHTLCIYVHTMTMLCSICLRMYSLHGDPNSLTHVEVNQACDSYVYPMGILYRHFNIADKTADQLESMLTCQQNQRKGF